MNPEVLVLLIFFVGLLLLNVPIAICIGLATLATLATLGDVPGAYVVSQRLASGVSSFPLLAIPFFVLAGYLMGEGGMARRLMDFAASLVGRSAGGLAYVNTLSCMLFGAVSGSAAAAVSSIGGFMVPQMAEKGYKKEFAVALTACSATTGLLIPPSNIMIVFAVVSGNVSVAALFMAGILPGLFVGLMIMLTSFVVLNLRRQAGPAARPAVAVAAPTSAGRGRAFVEALPSLFLMVLVLGGILGGLFSPTEASAVAVAYCAILSLFFYGELSWKQLPALLLKSASTTSVVMFLVGASQAMSWILAYERVPQTVSAALLEISSNPFIILLLINVLLLVVGTFMDMTPAVLIFTPIFLPVVIELGMDPVHFGIVMIANLCIGLCTPPVGTCLFVGCSVGKTSLAAVIPQAVPYFIGMMVALMVITYLPWLSLALPRWMGLLQ